MNSQMKRRTLTAGGVAVSALLLWVGSLFFGATGDAGRAPRLVAHAGGIVKGIVYTNSVEALEENFGAGHRYFELDMNFTADGHLVLIHDWDAFYEKLFENRPPGVPTREQFVSLQMIQGLHQMTVEDLYQWLDRHPETWVVTDVKSDNLRALAEIQSGFARHRTQIIPQVYDLNNYDAVRDMGFERIIVTLYRTGASNEQILEFAAENDVFAFTMFPKRGAWMGLGRDLRSMGQVVYFHTVNSPERADALTVLGVYGFYTDALTPR